MAVAAPAAPVPRNCAAELLASAATSPTKRPITSRDLIGLRDFGPMDNSVWQQAFSLSPKGNSVALIIRRGDPDRDDYCFGVLLVSFDGRARPRLLDVGGEYIQSAVDIRGIPAVPTGVLRAPPPVWSPDGRSLAYLRRDGGVTRAWRVGIDGQPAKPVGELKTDALAVRWSKNGDALIVSIRPALDAGVAAVQQEGRSGFHFDERFSALSEDKPRPGLPLPQTEIAIDPSTGALLPVEVSAKVDASVVASATSPDGVRASIVQAVPGAPWTRTPLRVERDGRLLDCPESVCGDHVGGLWWFPGETLLFLRAGHAANGGREILYRWRIGRDAVPRPVLETDEVLFGCQRADDRLICAHEGARQPRQLVSVNPDNGRLKTIFDPNPTFSNLRLGVVERVTWKLPDGVETYGDLVLPPDHRQGERHPLIVTQYISRGFLRGGTGDEYPIHVLAAHGFAVLSFQRPAPLPAAVEAKDLIAVQRVNIADWAERRVIVAALETGVDTVIARGVVNPARMGLTGMSDGATTTQFALNHSARFKVAALSSCCDEPSGLFSAGPAYGEATLAWGYPQPGPGHAAFWAPMSIAAHAAGWRTPLLIQVPDMEYRLGLETMEAFRLSGAPVDAYIFPDEHHLKWHPEHKLAVYERSLAWFDFWLRGIRSDDPTRATEMARWEAMKRRLDDAAPSAPHGGKSTQ
ncbi:MAG: Atxe2 family lasso peptide isopeptidase [Sphingomonas sp.]